MKEKYKKQNRFISKNPVSKTPKLLEIIIEILLLALLASIIFYGYFQL